LLDNSFQFSALDANKTKETLPSQVGILQGKNIAFRSYIYIFFCGENRIQDSNGFDFIKISWK